MGGGSSGLGSEWLHPVRIVSITWSETATAAGEARLDFGENRGYGVDLFGLGYQCGQGWLVLDERTGIDNQAVDALLALGRSALLCSHFEDSL